MKGCLEIFAKFGINLVVSLTCGVVAEVTARSSLETAVGTIVAGLVYGFLRIEDKLDDLRSR